MQGGAGVFPWCVRNVGPCICHVSSPF
jgi:hypothetical protein